MNTDAYYARVQSAYDRIAPEYDESIGRYAVSRRAKQLALRIIKELTPAGGRLLDVGCYTGIEGLLLAQQGYNVVGVDLSSAMIRVAQNKAKKWRLQDRTQFENLRASELGRLNSGRFDTVYSVYGTLNLEPRLSEFKRALQQLTKDRGYFVCGLLNPTVLYELVVAPLLLKFQGYKKLKKQNVKTRIGLGDDTLNAFYYTPRDFRALMQPEFFPVRVVGLHILYPPPRGASGTGLWWAARAFDSLEARVENRFPFSNLGFFSLLVFRKS